MKNTKQPWWHCSLFAHRGNEVPSETNPTPNPQLRFLRSKSDERCRCGRQAGPRNVAASIFRRPCFLSQKNVKSVMHAPESKRRMRTGRGFYPVVAMVQGPQAPRPSQPKTLNINFQLVVQSRRFLHVNPSTHDGIHPQHHQNRNSKFFTASAEKIS